VLLETDPLRSEGSSKSARRQPAFLQILINSFENRRPKPKGQAFFQLLKTQEK